MNINKVMLCGHLTRDPELRTTTSGLVVCNCGIAVNHKYGKGDDKKEEVCFVDLTAFGKSAEAFSQYMKKGRAVFIEGRLKFDSWTDKQGQKRSKLGVIIESWQFADSNKGETQPQQEGGNIPEADDDIPF